MKGLSAAGVICLFVSLSTFIIFTGLPVVEAATYSCNSCSDCNDYIQNSSSDDIIVLFNDLVGVSGNCIEFYGQDNVTFDCGNHPISGSGTGYGIYLNMSSQNNTIKNCINISYFSMGIFVFTTCTNNTFINTEVHNSTYGIIIDEGGSNNTFIDLTVRNCTTGILNSRSNYNRFISPRIYNNANGIRYNLDSSYNEVSDMIAWDNNHAFDSLGTSGDNEYNIFNDSYVYGNTIGFYMEEVNYNTFVNISVSDNSDSGFFMDNSDRNMFNEITAVNNGNSGIIVDSICTGNVFEDINASENGGDGIYVNVAYWNSFTNIVASGNVNSGIRFYSSLDDNNVSSLIAEHNGESGLYLLDLQAGNFNIIDIQARNNNYGMRIESGNKSNFTDLVLEDNTYGIFLASNSHDNWFNDSFIQKNNYGIYFSHSGTDVPRDNVFFNIYFNNSQNVVNTTSTTNHFNIYRISGTNIVGGPWIGGNYWTDYDGSNYSDFCTDIELDGICDVSYLVDGGNYDHYALTKYIHDIEYPIIISYDITPKIIFPGESVYISVTASDDMGVDTVSANVTFPDGRYQTITMPNNSTYEYFTDDEVDGVYNINISVSDTIGKTTYITDVIRAFNATNITINITNRTGDGLEVDIYGYYPSTTDEVISFSSSSGFIINHTIHDTNLDLMFSVFDGDLEVTLENLDIDANSDRWIMFEAFNGSIIYYINSSFTADDGKARISYDGTNMNESRLRVFSCDEWSFTLDNCYGDLESTSYTQDEDNNYFEVTELGSLFEKGVMLIIDESWCGDAECTPGFEDTTTCNVDCECMNGTQRSCNQTWEGICGYGVETCEEGIWVGCDVKEEEVCNSKDDDCDGVIDNVDGGTSVQETQCQCYNGGESKSETCNGIDDNCNDNIDEGGGCCEEGATRGCGPSTELGKCENGTLACVNNVWSGNCVGAIFPDDFEHCTNNIDDDCDGLTDWEDDQCDHCTNNKVDFDETGVDCGGDDCGSCMQFPWYVLAIIGAVILVLLYMLMKTFKKEGKELTWEELKKKYSEQPQY